MFKRIIYTILLIIWVTIIFIFSHQDANKSKATSDKVASIVIDSIQIVTKQEITKEKKQNWIENTRVLVRKSAHFILYLILGILSYLTLTSYQIPHPILYSVLFCFLYAISDEIHQLFLDGRTAKLTDVLIDTCGSGVGCLIVFLLKKI